MFDLLKRPLSHGIAAFVSLVSRLTRVAIARELIEAFTTAYDEAAKLEASGKPALARFLRAELDATLGDAPDADPTPRPALNGDGHRHSFSLPRPDAAANEPEGQGSATPGRRGRRPRKNAEAAHEAPPQQATEPADPSTTPRSNENHHI